MFTFILNNLRNHYRETIELQTKQASAPMLRHQILNRTRQLYSIFQRHLIFEETKIKIENFNFILIKFRQVGGLNSGTVYELMKLLIL